MYTDRSVTTRTRNEYKPTSMMSAPQPLRCSTACCCMVDLLGRKSHAWISAPSACHRTEGQVLGANLNCGGSENRRHCYFRAKVLLSNITATNIEKCSRVLTLILSCTRLPVQWKILRFCRIQDRAFRFP